MDIHLNSEYKHIPRVEMVCRFCLTQENISSITAEDYLQIMICPTINQYDDEDIPAFMCEDCRRLIEHSHNFHKMCKKANKLLAQYQFTGVLPLPLEKPLLPAHKTTAEASTNTSCTTNRTASIAIQTDEDEIDVQDIEYAVLNEASSCISNSNDDEELHNSETLSLDEARSQQDVTDEPMFSETSILYEPVSGETDETDDTLILGDDEEINDLNNYEDENENIMENFTCEFCDLTFPLRQLRDIHLNEHNRPRKFQCDRCNKKFYTKKDLNQHETVHSDEKPFKCSLCSKGYTRKSSLDRHESRHTELPKYLCIYCDKSFPSRLILEDHMQIHEKAQKFVCNICYKSFGFRKNLIRHSAVHQQFYPCEYCDEGFATQKKLTTHLLTHSLLNTAVVYYCEKCEKSFPTSKKLNRHMTLHNEKNLQKSLNCFYCNLNFTNREEYVKHTAVHSKENLICTLCMMQFPDAPNADAEIEEHIKLHIKGELFSCEFCNFLCLTETELSLHTC